MEMKFLDSLGRWISTVDELAALIWKLKESGFFIVNNPKKILPIERVFFEKRYNLQKSLKSKTKPYYKNGLKTKMKLFIIPDL